MNLAVQILEAILGFYLFTIVSYFLWNGLFFYLFWVRNNKFTDRHKINASPFLAAEVKRDILTSLYAGFFTTLPVSILFLTPIKNYTRIYDRIDEHGYVYFALTIVVSVFIHDFYYYWSHRILHNSRLFKYIHYKHHQRLNPNPFSPYFASIWEELLFFIYWIPLVFIMPMNFYAWILFATTVLIVGSYGHGNIELFPESTPFLMRPTGHAIHHQNFKFNYGFYFSFWDKFMGTYRATKKSKDT